MDIKQLKKHLNSINVPQSYYAINGCLVADTYVLNQVYTKWEYFYFDEKGNREGYKSFNNESEACEYFLGKLRNEIRYSTGV